MEPKRRKCTTGALSINRKCTTGALAKWYDLADLGRQGKTHQNRRAPKRDGGESWGRWGELGTTPKRPTRPRKHGMSRHSPVVRMNQTCTWSATFNIARPRFAYIANMRHVLSRICNLERSQIQCSTCMHLHIVMTARSVTRSYYACSTWLRSYEELVLVRRSCSR